MKRLLAAVIALGVGIGLADPYACVQHAAGNSLRHDVPARDRARVLAAARRALALLPAPRGYVLDGESVASEAEPTAPWSDAASRWAAPAAARAERAYEPPDPEASNAPPALEQRVFVNGEVALPSGLASEGGPVRALPVAGAAAVEVTTAGIEESPAGGRVALPVTPAQAATSLTIVRVLIANPAVERAFRKAAGSGRLDLPASKPPRGAGSVETLVVELYGGRRDVEALARRVPVAALRRLLDRQGSSR